MLFRSSSVTPPRAVFSSRMVRMLGRRGSCSTRRNISVNKRTAAHGHWLRSRRRRNGPSRSLLQRRRSGLQPRRSRQSSPPPRNRFQCPCPIGSRTARAIPACWAAFWEENNRKNNVHKLRTCIYSRKCRMVEEFFRQARPIFAGIPACMAGKLNEAWREKTRSDGILRL